MRQLILWTVLVFISMTMMVGSSQSEDRTAILSLIIDAEMPMSATSEQVASAESNLYEMYNQIKARNLVATIFSTQDTLRSHANLRLTRIGIDSEFELGLSGNNSNEKISNMPYENQIALLRTSKSYVEACKICGKNNITAYGFMPQSFNQNRDTYRALDELDILYDTGFQAGLIYTPGHENDVWPYLVEGHKFYAVPVSTYTLSDKKVVLQDSYFKNNDFDAAQWYDALVGKFDEIQGKDEPLVISLTTSVSGQGDYLDALNRFMDYAISKKASFVTTEHLVDLAKTGVHDVSSLTTNVSSECLTCGQTADNSISITASISKNTQAANNTTQVASDETKAA